MRRLIAAAALILFAGHAEAQVNLIPGGAAGLSGLNKFVQQFYQNQGYPPVTSYFLRSDVNNTVYAGNFNLVNADLSQFRAITIASATADGAVTISDSVASGGPYTASYTVQGGDTNNLIAIGLCKAFLNTPGWMAALAAYKPANPFVLVNGYYPVQAAATGASVNAGCAAQSTAGVFAFDYPAGFGTLAVSKTGTTTISLSAAVADGGPQFQIGRLLNRAWISGDLGPWLSFQANLNNPSGGLDTQIANIYTQQIAATSTALKFSTVQGGTSADRFGLAAGATFASAAQSVSSCGDPGNGKVRHCGTTSGTGDEAYPAALGSSVWTWPASTGTVLLSSGARFFNAGLSNPTGTTSLTGVMMGLGSTCTITPVNAGRVRFSLQGTISNDTILDGALVALNAGTGTAPTNGAAPAGAIGSRITGITAVTPAGAGYPFTVSLDSIALTVGVAYWFDAQLQANTAGTASIANLQCMAEEF